MATNSDKFIEIAAEQVLCNVLGYDEGRVYLHMIMKKDAKIEEELSYSKCYRMKKNLFNYGAVGKIKNGKDYFYYIPLPPTFLYYLGEVDKKIIEHLEEIYLKNHKEIFMYNFAQLLLKDSKSFISFMVRTLIKNEARLMLDSKYYEKLLSAELDKIKKLNIDEGFTKTMGIIDDEICFEFMNLNEESTKDLIGYISRKDDHKEMVKRFLGVEL